MKPTVLETISGGNRPGSGFSANKRARWKLALVTLAVLGSLLVAPLASAQDLSPQAPPIYRYQWSIERADRPKLFYNMSSHSFKIDKHGNGHVAYGGDNLYYAHWRGDHYDKFTIDSSDSVGQYASLALDANGDPHISYYDAYNGRLKYARYSSISQQWIIDVVDEPAQNATNSMQLEVAPASQVEAGPVRPWQEPAFEADAVDQMADTSLANSGGVGMYSSIAIDTEGRPHISYYDAINRNLKYAYRDTSRNPPVWVIDTVNNRAMGNDYGTWTSLAVVNVGDKVLPLISFMDETLDDLHFITGKIGDWEPVEVVDGGDIKGGYTSLAVGANGRVYISYYSCGERTSDNLWQCSKGDLRFAERKGQDDWSLYNVDTKDNVGGWSSLVMDKDNRAHISYYDFTNGNLRYAKGSGDNWELSVRASTGDVGRFSSITLDPNNLPHISFVDFDNSRLSEAVQYLDVQKKLVWLIRDIDQFRDAGYSTSLELNAAGEPIISYFENTRDDLYLTWSENNSWLVPPVTVDWVGSTGLYTSLELDSLGRPQIAYYDASKGDLRYAHFNGTQYVTQTISSYRDVGRYPSLALTSQDVPMVAYYDVTNGDAIFGSWNASASRWITQTVDTKGNVGQFMSMALDTNNNPHLSYFDADNGSLKYAVWNGVEWIRQTVDDDTKDVNPSVLGWYTSLAIDADNRANISYYECGILREGVCTEGDLKFAHQVLNGAELVWVTETVDDPGNWFQRDRWDVGLYTSLAIKGNNRYISYYDATNDDLRMAFFDGSRWRVDLVDSAGDVGRYTSLALDATGNPHISYYDFTNGDLKYASGLPVAQQGILYLPRLER